MLFTSCIFLFLFLPAVLAGYYLLRSTPLRNLLLTLASLFFYTWGEVGYCWVMLAVIAFNYATAILIEDTGNRRRQQLLLASTVVFDLGMLGWFKYAGFFAGNANVLLHGLQMPTLEIGSIHLPLGISFFVFHSLSYVVDVYRKVAHAQRNPFNMALYISLFPQLIAGPIVRYHDICDQLTARSHSVEKFAEGIRRFVIGLSKKMLIANLLAVPADKIFALPSTELNAGVAWLGALAYTFQIYFDFSGYSDMAVGLGLMFGFKLPENFNYPYAACSMRDFWQRWHISLSNWFRDYLYIPLGGNRVPPWRVCTNLLTVFFLCGLWHGASWQFIAWGLYHGSFLGAERLFLGRVIESWWKPIQHAYVAMAVILGWVLFRSASLEQAGAFYRAMLGFAGQPALHPVSLYLNNEIVFIFALALIACLPISSYVTAAAGRPKRRVPILAFGTACYLALFAFSICEIAAGTYNPFIYFRF